MPMRSSAAWAGGSHRARIVGSRFAAAGTTDARSISRRAPVASARRDEQIRERGVAPGPVERWDAKAVVRGVRCRAPSRAAGDASRACSTPAATYARNAVEGMTVRLPSTRPWTSSATRPARRPARSGDARGELRTSTSAQKVRNSARLGSPVSLATDSRRRPASAARGARGRSRRTGQGVENPRRATIAAFTAHELVACGEPGG